MEALVRSSERSLQTSLEVKVIFTNALLAIYVLVFSRSPYVPVGFHSALFEVLGRTPDFPLILPSLLCEGCSAVWSDSH